MNPRNKGGTVWSRQIGRARRNRVTVRQRKGLRIVEMIWREGGRDYVRSLRHGDRARAVLQAMDKAEELRVARGTHKPTAVLMAMRADLLAVAHGLGLPAGTAPPRKVYAKLGRYSECSVRAAFRGYTTTDRGSVVTRDQWGDAIRKYGLTMAGDRRKLNYGLAAADVRRVAMMLGAPRTLPTRAQYAKHGKWSTRSVMDHMRVGSWVALATKLELDVSALRLRRSENCRGGIGSRWRRDTREAA